jgi:hypothetical protein
VAYVVIAAVFFLLLAGGIALIAFLVLSLFREFKKRFPPPR